MTVLYFSTSTTYNCFHNRTKKYIPTRSMYSTTTPITIPAHIVTPTVKNQMKTLHTIIFINIATSRYLQLFTFQLH